MTLPESFYVPLERDLLRLTGRDRQSFLQGMLTNDIASLTPGQNCYAFHLTSKGQILADCYVLCSEDGLLLDTEPGWGEPLAASLEHHLVMERVKIRLTTQIVYFIYEAGQWRALYDAPSPPVLPMYDEALYEALRIEAPRLLEQSLRLRPTGQRKHVCTEEALGEGPRESIDPHHLGVPHAEHV